MLAEGVVDGNFAFISNQERSSTSYFFGGAYDVRVLNQEHYFTQFDCKFVHLKILIGLFLGNCSMFVL